MTATALLAGLKLQVAEVTAQTPSITSITFTDPAGGPLPAYVPGSHLLVQCGDGVNAYSLTGSGRSPSDYSVSVLRVASGAGGSAAMHRLRAGDRVLVSRPRSAFTPMATARHHLLIAGGIGVTPMLSHARAAAEWGMAATMIYMYRPAEGAHVPELRELLDTRLVECTDRGSFRQALAEKLSSQRLGTHLYVCGPAAFMESVLASARELGWPETRLHSEPFGTPELDAGQPFRAKLTRSGIQVEIPAGVSLLEALEGADVGVPNMCRKGVCGECSVAVLRGTPQHRDLYLSEDQKASGRTMMCCVSRSLDQELELDL